MARTYYDVLGVSQEATKSAIKTAFREKAKLVHPDTVQAQTANLGSYAAERLKATLEQDFRELTEAYEVLSDSQKRQEYDDFLLQLQDASAPPPYTQPSPQARSPQPSTPPPAYFCIACGTKLIAGDCPACVRRKKPFGSRMARAKAIAWILGSMFAVLIAATLPKDSSWDANICTSMLTILGITAVVAKKKLWGGIKRLCRTKPKLGWLTVEGVVLVVLSLIVGASNTKPQNKLLPTQAAAVQATAPPLSQQFDPNASYAPAATQQTAPAQAQPTQPASDSGFIPNASYPEPPATTILPLKGASKKSAVQSLTGEFVGVVRNQTANRSADFGVNAVFAVPAVAQHASLADQKACYEQAHKYANDLPRSNPPKRDVSITFEAAHYDSMARICYVEYTSYSYFFPVDSVRSNDGYLMTYVDDAFEGTNIAIMGQINTSDCSKVNLNNPLAGGVCEYVKVNEFDPMVCEVSGQKCDSRAQFNEFLWKLIPAFKPASTKK